MNADAESEAPHPKAGERLAAGLGPAPATAMLQQLLDQMLANERRRLRNENIRITVFCVVLLAAAVGGGFWFARNLLDRLETERQMTDRSMRAMRQRIIAREAAPPTTFGSAPARPAPLSKPGAPPGDARAAADLPAGRDAEMQILYKRIQDTHRKIMSAPSPEPPAAGEIKNPPPKEAAGPPAAPTAVDDSLTVTTTNAIRLRLPIPKP